MTVGSLALFLAAAFVAEVVGTIAGFGAATILTPIAAIFLDMQTAIAIVTCFHLSGNVSRLWFFGRHVRWNMALSFGVTGVLCSLIGAMLTTHLTSLSIKLLFGLFLLGYVIIEVMVAGRLTLPQTPATLVTGGAVSGFIAGLLGTGGAIRSACLFTFGLPKEAYLGTSALLALLVDGTRLPVYLTGRFLSSTMVPVILALMVVAWLGAWTGQHLIRRVSAPVFRRLVLGLLALMGVKLLVEGWVSR